MPYLIVAPKPVPAASLGAARCASQVLDRSAQAVVHGTARCGSQALDRGAKAAESGVATLPQQEKGTH
jgi:hypothetical protein